MDSHLIRKSLSILPRKNQHLSLRPRSRLYRSRSSSRVKTFSVIVFASLGLSLVIYLGHLRFWCSRHSTAANSVLAHFTSKPPLVDRTILEKIAGLDLEGESNSESRADFSIPIDGNFPPFLRPPRVTRIPEIQPQAPSNLGMETQVHSEENADHVSPSRKFLLPLKISEQGVDAHVHLAQLLELARTLNRTLVLPNVGKNKVGACSRWRFGVYYDEQALLSKLDGEDSSRVIQQDRFKTWVDSLGFSPSSQLVSVDWTYPKGFPRSSPHGQNDDGLDLYIYRNPKTATTFHSFAGCLSKKFPQLDLTNLFPSLSFVVADRWKESRSGEDIFRALLEKLSKPALNCAQSDPLKTISEHSTDCGFDDGQLSPDVLMVSWNMPLSPFQPHPATATHHPPQLRALAARLVKRLGSYIAVAWNVETSESDSVLGCVEALKSTLHYVLNSHEQLEIRNVWLAGNLSPSVFPHSSESLCKSTLAEESFFASDVKLTGIHQELEKMVREGEEVDDVANNGGEVVRKQEVLKDAGVLRILDKLVSMKSTVFVTASKDCGKTRCVPVSLSLEFHRGSARKSSFFTREILDWREGNGGNFFAEGVEPRNDRVWEETDRVAKVGGVVEFG